MSKRRKQPVRIAAVSRAVPTAARTRDLHLSTGWWMVAGFAFLGLVLESLHGFKVSFYVAEDVQPRRLCWMLAHASGVLLGLLNIGFAATVMAGQFSSARRRLRASLGLLSASIGIPMGFFLAGLFAHREGVGSGIIVVYLAVAFLLSALLATARAPSR